MPSLFYKLVALRSSLQFHLCIFQYATTMQMETSMHASRIRILTIFTLILCSLLVFSSVQAASRGLSVIGDLSHKSGKLGAYRALVIGINDYEDSKIPDLETAANDARAVAEVLRGRYGFQVKLILDRKATREAIYKALRSLASSTKPDDSVLIYYAGHGDFDRTYDDGWWIPADAKGGNPVTYLDNGQVQKAMRSMNARHVLLISDSCYSGTLFGQARAMPPVIDDKYYLNLYNERSRWGMTSGNKTPVSDRGSSGHSVFAYQLLKELKKNEKPYISTQEIYTRIAPVIGNNSEQTPLCRPVLNTGDQGGEFVFVGSMKKEEAIVTSPANIDKELVFWQSIQNSNNISSFEAYLDKFPNGTFAPLAKIKISELKQKKEIAAISPEVIKSKLFVETTPENARIRIRNIKPKFYQGIQLEPGRYHVEVSKNGYKTKELWVKLEAGEDKRRDIRLERAAVSWQGHRMTNSIGMAFVKISPGTFTIGSPSSEPGRDGDEKQHQVTLTQGFYMQTTEVTQGQWRAVMGSNPSYFQNCGDDCPVEQVSWDDVQEFIRKLNQREGGKVYRLPTEAEWEYSARAGSTSPFANGGISELNYGYDFNLHKMGWYGYNSAVNYGGCYDGSKQGGRKCAGTHPVSHKQPNDWDLYDMHGNVWEWCQDWEGDYPSGFETDPTGPSTGSDRVARGGSWFNSARYCRSADRRSFSPGNRLMRLGFRLLRIH
jgi:formylglycine-generating enzyme required for sulfatase activity